MYRSQRGPWYTRLRMACSSSYNGSRAKFCGVCATCFIFLGIFLTITGAIITSSVLDDSFTRNDWNNNFKKCGPVLLSAGLMFIIVSTVLFCVFSVGDSRRQEGRVFHDNNQIPSEDTTPLSPIYLQQPQITSTTTSSYNYQYNAPAPYYPSRGNIANQPPAYDNLIGAQPYNPNLVQVNNLYGNASSAYVLPTATELTVADVHPYPVPDTK